MSLPNLDMAALRSLVAILHRGGLARAAERIGRSPSAISQQMRKLELQLGEPLFRKHGRRVVLTEAGDRVHAYARRILELNDEAVHAVRGAAIDGTVRFGLPGDFAESWLPAALGKFRKAYPAVRVDVLVEPNRLLLERLDRGELDLVLAMNQGGRADAERLATLPMTWIGPAGTGEVVRPDAVLDLALYQPPCFFRAAGTGGRAPRGARPPRPVPPAPSRRGGRPGRAAPRAHRLAPGLRPRHPARRGGRRGRGLADYRAHRRTPPKRTSTRLTPPPPP